jgi:DNA-directed RNA polymerase specialized sigma24 family protein
VAPRQAAVVESRFFGGFDTLETALLLEISEATVTRDWRSARAWLAHRLRPSATREDASAR